MQQETLRKACVRLVAEGDATPIMGSSVIRLDSSNSPEVLRRMEEIEADFAKEVERLEAEMGRKTQAEMLAELRDFVFVPPY